MSPVGLAAPLKNIHSVTIKLQVLSFNKTNTTGYRNLNDHLSLKAVTSFVPTKPPLLEPLFGIPLWGRASKAVHEPQEKISFQMLGCSKSEKPLKE